MRTAAGVLLVLACSGCAVTSEELSAEKPPIAVKSPQAPGAAIGCVARVYESAANVTVGTRQGAEPGTWEASARTPNGMLAMLYAIARPTPDGSDLRVWISQFIGIDELVAKLRGC